MSLLLSWFGNFSRLILVALMTAVLLTGGQAAAQSRWATAFTEGDYFAKNFRFASGETIGVLQLHYRVAGTPQRNAAGEIDNAVVILHSSSSSGAQFLAPQFADELYGPGQPLDLTRFYVILPDAIGHGNSSKPSDGLRAHFPHYDYDDMVEAVHSLLVEGLGVKRLRLLMGVSMGCMNSFVWAETYPKFARAIMPQGCMPVQVAGSNLIWRKSVVDAIQADPAWKGGDYTTPPQQALRTAISVLTIAGGEGPLRMQRDYPTSAAAAAFLDARMKRDLASLDANDLMYQIEASRNYDPEPKLEEITAPLTWVNAGDDFLNQPGQDVITRSSKRIRQGVFYLIPASNETHGHGTHRWAVFWKQQLVDLLARSQ